MKQCAMASNNVNKYDVIKYASLGKEKGHDIKIYVMSHHKLNHDVKKVITLKSKR